MRNRCFIILSINFLKSINFSVRLLSFVTVLGRNLRFLPPYLFCNQGYYGNYIIELQIETKSSLPPPLACEVARRRMWSRRHCHPLQAKLRIKNHHTLVKTRRHSVQQEHVRRRRAPGPGGSQSRN
jgi:hypothetical protein